MLSGRKKGRECGYMALHSAGKIVKLSGLYERIGKEI
jgi:hypothetical protein